MRVWVSLLESSVRALSGIAAPAQPYVVRLIQDWFLLRKPPSRLLWPVYAAFYVAFIVAFVMLIENAPALSSGAVAASAALFRLVAGLVEGHRRGEAKP
jgi:hypothetical protein